VRASSELIGEVEFGDKKEPSNTIAGKEKEVRKTMRLHHVRGIGPNHVKVRTKGSQETKTSQTQEKGDRRETFIHALGACTNAVTLCRYRGGQTATRGESSAGEENGGENPKRLASDKGTRREHHKKRRRNQEQNRQPSKKNRRNHLEEARATSRVSRGFCSQFLAQSIEPGSHRRRKRPPSARLG